MIKVIRAVKKPNFYYFICNRHKSTAGFSLVEVMVGAAMVGILALASTSLTQNFQKGLRDGEERLGTLELKKVLMTIASGKNLCQHDYVADPTPFTFATTAFPPASLSIQSLYLNPTDPDPLIAVGTLVPGLNKATVSGITITDITGTTSPYFARMKIDFANTSIARRPTTVIIQIETTIVGTDTKISGCSVLPDTGGGTGLIDQSAQNCAAASGTWVIPPAPRPPFCDLDGDSLNWF